MKSEANHDDPWVFAGLARHHAVSYLETLGVRALKDDLGMPLLAGNIGREPLANNSMLLFSGRYNIRVHKAKGGKIPSPSGSRAKRDFYAQMPLGLRFRDELPEVNLLVLWDSTVDFDLGVMHLVRPSVDTGDEQQVEPYWSIPVTHLADSTFARSGPEASSGEGQSSRDDDLPLRLSDKDEDIGGGEGTIPE